MCDGSFFENFDVYLFIVLKGCCVFECFDVSYLFYERICNKSVVNRE